MIIDRQNLHHHQLEDKDDHLEKEHHHPEDAHHLHHHHHNHDYSPESNTGARLLITLILNFIIPVSQIIGGIVANSVALISDAVHNFSDFTAILISYIAFRIGQRGATLFNTFGYRRAEIMAAMINVLLLTAASGVILYHAVQRFFNPETVNGIPVMILAGIGIIGNGISALMLHRDAAHNLNMRGAFLHMIGDLLTSVVVLINGFILMFYDWYWLDPLLSVVIVIFILKNSWSLLKDAVSVLMNATPSYVPLENVKKLIESMPGVVGVHYLHAWQISSSNTAFSCHVVVPDQLISQSSQLLEEIKHQLFHKFKIDHPILQFEIKECGKGSLLCEMSCSDDLTANNNP
ncbi:MAG: cation transporter [Desulfamplus sp.]|nr:cation transporter [Desulfamplus sp.]